MRLKIGPVVEADGGGKEGGERGGTRGGRQDQAGALPSGAAPAA